ncbi:MAG: preprotein translocase subunit SecE [Planctomycetota bacterium]
MTAYLQQLFQFGTYKSKQGRVARQATFGALAVVAAAGAWALKSALEASSDNLASSAGAIAIGVALAGFWAAYRLVQLPKFAEFLIDVEHEMNKVSWPSRGELWKASLVVILTIFVLAALLFLYDLLWSKVLEAIFFVAGQVL